MQNEMDFFYYCKKFDYNHNFVNIFLKINICSFLSSSTSSFSSQTGLSSTNFSNDNIYIAFSCTTYHLVFLLSFYHVVLR